MSQLRVGYVPINEDLISAPGDYRRFAWYAENKGITFEIADFNKKYDLVVLTEAADISVWNKYKHGKIVYDLIDPYLAISKRNISGLLRAPVKSIFGQYKKFTFNNWNVIRKMCTRADAVICSTVEQKKDITPYCDNVKIILDSHVDIVTKIKKNYECGDVIKIVWEGLPSSIQQLAVLSNVFYKLNGMFNIELHVVTDLYGYRFLGKYLKTSTKSLSSRIFSKVVVHEWSKDEFSNIVCSCDIAVIPVRLNDEFSAGRPENKLLLFWKMAIPTVTSSTLSYKRTMKEVGFKLACEDERDWINSLARLIENVEFRKEVGERGLKYVDEKFNKESLIRQWDMVFNSLGFYF